MNNLYHVIKDPVHGSMQFTDEENNWIKPFIDSPNLQRLRHIKQLGLGDLIFPGAMHTRFNHVIGCCYVAGQIATTLNLPTNERKIVMLAGLLHDIGHGPFSHAFEGIFHDNVIHHEDWTPLFLKEYLDDGFIQRFNAHNQKNPLSKNEFTTIKNLIMHRENDKKLLADIVSSQLDADRLDYLRRDSHFCGVNYGNYDFQWLLHCMAVVPDSNGDNRLGITTKGIGVVEHYLMARRLMMRNVYLHGKKYAAEFLLTCFLKKLAKSIVDEKLFSEIKEKNLARFLIQVEQFNQKVKHEKNPGVLKKEFLMEHYNLYKHLCDYDIFSMVRYFSGLDLDHDVVLLAKRLHSRQLPKVMYIRESQLQSMQEKINTLQNEKNIRAWQVGLIELPHQAYQGQQDPILVIDKMKNIRTLQDDSIIINQISDKLEKSYLVYVDREIKELPAVVSLMQS